jgi:hypothetical protein
MPDIVSDDDLSPLAAEYVLGTLDPDERTRANVLLDVDHQFRGMVRIWERRLGELHLMVEPVDPDAKIWERIRGKLNDIAPGTVMTAPAAPATSATPAPAMPAPPVAPATSATSVPPPPPVSVEVTPEAASADKTLSELIEEVEKISGSMQAEAKPADIKPADIPPPLPPSVAAAWKAAEPELPQAEVEPEPEEESEPPPLAPEPSEQHLPERISGDAGGPLLFPSVVSGPRDHGREAEVEAPERRPRVGRWRALAALMTLVAISLGGLIAAWRYIPDRLPPQLRPASVLNMAAAPGSPARKPAPPESQFDE